MLIEIHDISGQLNRSGLTLASFCINLTNQLCFCAVCFLNSPPMPCVYNDPEPARSHRVPVSAQGSKALVERHSKVQACTPPPPHPPFLHNPGLSSIKSSKKNLTNLKELSQGKKSHQAWTNEVPLKERYINGVSKWSAWPSPQSFAESCVFMSSYQWTSGFLNQTADEMLH